MKLDIVFIGLSITSSWGNGHATTYRALIRALAERGHKLTFLERNTPWYREHRDAAALPYCRVELYGAVEDVPHRFGALVAKADLVVLGSYVPDGAKLGAWMTRIARGMTAFYDIDTPVTLKGLANRDIDYIDPALIPRFDLYLSFTGGPMLQHIERTYGSPRARALYCAVDPERHAPVKAPLRWAVGYLGTYSADRQLALERLLIEPARRRPDLKFVVAGAQYPDAISWPANVERIEHIPPAEHPQFYCGQWCTLNLTRADMMAAGYSPSVRLFEAAACGVPVVTDRWPGIETFLTPRTEILLADTPDDILRILDRLTEAERGKLASAARYRVLQNHTAHHRARQLENYYEEVRAISAGIAKVEAVA